jgi:hypothetical protein
MLCMSMKKLSVCLTAATALAACAAAAAFTKPDFPRVGGIQIGSPMNYNDANYQANLAKQSVMILGMYPGLKPGGLSMNSVVQGIKAKNSNALVFLYVATDDVPVASSASSDAYASIRSKVDSMKWWLYSDKSLSAAVPSWFDSKAKTVNNSIYTPKDSNGDNGIDWITKYYVSNYFTPNPSIDGFFMDNTTVQPTVAGDWLRNGVIEQTKDGSAGTAIRQGYARYYALSKSLMPNKLQIGNLTTWAASGTAIPKEYQNMVNGGVMEGFVGKSWSVESWGGWAAMMKQYTTIMGAITEPKLGIFNQWGDPSDYQSMRYGLGSCLLNDAYYSFTDDSKAYSGVVWFDELDQKLGQGQTIPAAAWQKGVWRRDFDNGIVLVNPKGNGAQTLTLESSYVKIKGTQDPATNNGQTVTTITLKDRDGIILMRKNPLKRPAAPQKLSAGT